MPIIATDTPVAIALAHPSVFMDGSGSTIDLSIVYPYEDKEPDTRAAEQAHAKWNAHHRAVEAVEHIFIPVVIETTGCMMDQEAFKLIALTRQKVRAITVASQMYKR